MYESKNLCFTESIKDYPGYIITRDGRIFSLTRKTRSGQGCRIIKGKELKLQLNGAGYFTVRLSEKGKTKTLLVSRLVAKTFIPNPENKPEANHFDGNTQNNNDWNLVWATSKENTQHAFDKLNRKSNLLGRFGSKNSRSRKINQIKDGEIIKTWDCMRDAKRAGFTDTSISACCRRKRKSHAGFQWEYAISD